LGGSSAVCRRHPLSLPSLFPSENQAGQSQLNEELQIPRRGPEASTRIVTGSLPNAHDHLARVSGRTRVALACSRGPDPSAESRRSSTKKSVLSATRLTRADPPARSSRRAGSRPGSSLSTNLSVFSYVPVSTFSVHLGIVLEPWPRRRHLERPRQRPAFRRRCPKSSHLAPVR
jgi:hypothetical protein